MTTRWFSLTAAFSVLGIFYVLEGVKCNDAFTCDIPRFELLYTTVNSFFIVAILDNAEGLEAKSY